MGKGCYDSGITVLMGCPDSIKKKLPAPSRRQHQPKVVALLYEPLECNVYVKPSLREWKQPLICKSSFAAACGCPLAPGSQCGSYRVPGA
ncbi:hypothetical protein DY000_02017433 [Brassica cretica]|uniref:Uncharacterized protein n=1 Tax=Brassica cretica TaxID=69181 RepID=A0ABQ7CMZ3_BRACR|nr:hypothetical protein DY000_02017433 [Brassica cretica]